MQPARQVVYIVFAMILQKLGGLDGQGKLSGNFGQQRGHDALPGVFDNVHCAEQSHRVRPVCACVQISIQRLAARIAAQGLDGFRCAAETLVVGYSFNWRATSSTNFNVSARISSAERLLTGCGIST